MVETTTGSAFIVSNFFFVYTFSIFAINTTPSIVMDGVVVSGEDAFEVAVPEDADAVEVPPDTDTVRISNVVCTALFNQTIDLAKLAWAAHADFQPHVFAAVQLRSTNPQATALVFSSGRLVTTGAVSESAAMVSIFLFYRVIRRVNPDLVVRELNIQNIVASAAFDQCVKLDELVRAFCLDALFDSSLFPGLRLQLQNPKVKVLIFAKGRVVLTGARSREDLARAWALAKKLVTPYLTTEDISHKTLQLKRNVNKKLKQKAAIEDFND